LLITATLEAPPKSRVWKLDNSITHQSGSRATSSKSSSAQPMLPASATHFPLLRKICAISAVTVLLPLVPVTQIVCASGRSANHNAVPDVKRTPAASASETGDWYGLMPGDLMMTSNCFRAAPSAGDVMT